MDPFVRLAKDNIEHYVKTGQTIVIPTDLPKDMMGEKAGVFVSIHTKNNDLRGCIGTILPTTKCIANEILQNSVSACSQDPRFSPVQEEELDNLVINVDVLTKPVQVKDRSELNPKKYGVIVSTKDGRKGLLLPDLEGVDTVDYQISIAAQKGWIDEKKDELILERFEVVRHT